MAKDLWYRNAKWDDAIADAFEKRLSRAKGMRPQYLDTQGSDLIATGDPRLVRVGLALVKRAVADHPTSREAAYAHGSLFEHLMALGRYPEAETAARDSITYWRTMTDAGMHPSVPPHLPLAEAILAQRDRRRWPEIEEHIALAGESFEGNLIIPAVGYRFLLAHARVQRMYGGRGAAQSAQLALHYVDGPQGPNMGFPAALGARPQADEVKELRRILVLEKWPLRWIDRLARSLDPRSRAPQYDYRSYR